MDRRRFLAAGLVLTPVAASLAACGGRSGWPEGMAEIKWDRDTCTRCGMVISDRRFAAELRGGPSDVALKFDDVGCAVIWIANRAAEQPWLAEPGTRFWVADAAGKGESWLDARKAHYASGSMSPMGYNFSARAYAEAGSQAYEEMRQHVLAKGK